MKTEKCANEHKLTITEEETLLQWILSLDRRGAAPQPASVQDMANILLSERSPSDIQHRVGSNWVYNFINRHEELKTRYSRRYNHQRAKCEDPKIIHEWFERVQSTIQ